MFPSLGWCSACFWGLWCSLTRFSPAHWLCSEPPLTLRVLDIIFWDLQPPKEDVLIEFLCSFTTAERVLLYPQKHVSRKSGASLFSTGNTFILGRAACEHRLCLIWTVFENKPQYKTKHRELKPLTAEGEGSTEIPPLTTTITAVLEVGIRSTHTKSHYRMRTWPLKTRQRSKKDLGRTCSSWGVRSWLSPLFTERHQGLETHRDVCRWSQRPGASGVLHRVWPGHRQDGRKGTNPPGILRRFKRSNNEIDSNNHVVCDNANTLTC